MTVGVLGMIDQTFNVPDLQHAAGFGRSWVLHRADYVLGRGGDDDSKTTGNSGSRYAYALMGRAHGDEASENALSGGECTDYRTDEGRPDYDRDGITQWGTCTAKCETHQDINGNHYHVEDGQSVWGKCGEKRDAPEKKQPEQQQQPEQKATAAIPNNNSRSKSNRSHPNNNSRSKSNSSHPNNNSRSKSNSRSNPF